MDLEKIIEKILPEPSSFVPGKLAPNFMRNFSKSYGEDTSNLFSMPKGVKRLGLQVAIEFCRWGPTAITAYGKDDWSILYALAPYIITTWFLDRMSYYGIAGL